MIIDFHTHIFPQEVRENREEYLTRDRTFAEMYANPKAKIATAEELLQSRDEHGVDVSVALGESMSCVSATTITCWRRRRRARGES